MKSWGHLILHSRLYQDIVTLIVIDDAHILESWGDTLRPTFARLGELRSHFMTPFLMLTATCTQQIMKHITSRNHLPGLKMHTASPDRPNIYLEYKRSKDLLKS
ncbi:putative ATP-dependent DNA helicase RecS [Crassostrea virginica]